MRYREFMAEASYDGMVAKMKSENPDSVGEIIELLKSAKKTLKKDGRIVWFLQLMREYYRNGGVLPDINLGRGRYKFVSFAKLLEDIHHYMGYIAQGATAIDNYQFGKKTINELFTDLAGLEDNFQMAQSEKSEPVKSSEGDYKLVEFPDGSAWWFVDRGYCPEEGRSGKHCGNVLGQEQKDQRLLSYRIGGHVQLTFVLWPDGGLGEMKAKANQKPSPKFHPVIMWLLLNYDAITSIRGAGYAEWMNFSIFDLSDSDIGKLVSAGKENLIKTQIESTPLEFMKAPDIIRTNPEYIQIAKKKLPALGELIDNAGVISNSKESWDNAILSNKSMAVFSPYIFKDRNTYDMAVSVASETQGMILRSPKNVGTNFEFLSDVLKKNGERINEILPNTPRYEELALIAVKHGGSALQYIPEEFRDYELCLVAVEQNVDAINYVPVENADREMWETVLKNDGSMIDFVPHAYLDKAMYLLAVNQNGLVLGNLPEKYRDDLEICWAAIRQNGKAIRSVPEKYHNRKMYMAAVESSGFAIVDVPEEYQDEAMRMAAVKQDGLALQYIQPKDRTKELYVAAVKQNVDVIGLVPDEYLDKKMWKFAVKHDGLLLQNVPKEFCDLDMYWSAIKQNGRAIGFVPIKFRDFDMCRVAVENNSGALRNITTALIDQGMLTEKEYYEICLMAVTKNGSVLGYVSEKYRDKEMCMAAVRQKRTAIFSVPSALKAEVAREVGVE